MIKKVRREEIKGPIGFSINYFEDVLGEGFLWKYRGVRPSFRFGNMGYYKTLNFINGQNSPAAIYRALQAEL